MNLKTFSRGGVHPQENKLSATSPIEIATLPTSVSIPISQHLGAPAKALVKKGDMVKVGSIIAETSGFISANIHSSVSGKVSKVAEAMDSTGYRKMSILIDIDGDEWEENIDNSNTLIKETNLTNEEIIETVKKSGIVGLGGATFPTHVKLMVPPGKKVDVLVINGVECEPYLTADHRIMLEKADEIMITLTRLMKVVNCSKTIIGIENNKPDAIDHLKKVASNYTGIEITPLKVQYPQGGEKQLLDAALNKQVPPGALPIEVGAVVLNVGTIFAIYEAIFKNKPLIERVVTVTGKSLSSPKNFKARVGTPISHLIELAGGLPEDTGKVINGGPMMGKAVSTIEVPVTKGTSGVLIMKETESHRKKESPCIRCAKCVGVCPLNLEPYLLSRLGRKYMWDDLEGQKIMDCIECGSCSYTCPSNIPLLDYIRVGKSEVSKIIRARK